MFQLRACFDPDSQNREAEAAPERDGAVGQGAGFGLCGQLADDGAVELKPAQRRSGQVRQGCVIAANVVQGHAHAELGEPMQLLDQVARFQISPRQCPVSSSALHRLR